MGISHEQFLQMQARVAPKHLKCTTGEPAKREIGKGGLHEEIENYCKGKGWYCVHSRTDRPATNGVGTPDFIIAAPGGRTFWIEAKAKGKKPTLEQLAAVTWLTRDGHTAAIVYSMEQFRELIEKPSDQPAQSLPSRTVPPS